VASRVKLPRTVVRGWQVGNECKANPGRAGGLPPAPPQTRASGFPAHGSSSHGFVPLCYPPLSRVHDFGPLCVHRVSSRRSRNRVCPFPTPRLRAAPFAGFHRYYEQTKTPVGLLRALPLSVEHEYLSRFLCSLHLAGKSQLGGLVVDNRWRPLRYLSQDLDGSLMFPGNPIAPLPCSLTPVGPTSLTISGLRCCPRTHNNEGSSNIFISRLYHTASTLAVYASCCHC